MGREDPWAMLREMPSGLFTEWVAYDSVSPIGNWRRDLGIVRLEALLSNIHRDHKVHPAPYSVKDLVQGYGSERDLMSVDEEDGLVVGNDEMLEKMAHFALSNGGVVVRERDGDE